MSLLLNVKAYGNIKQQRLRAILAASRTRVADRSSPSVTLPTKLDIEHVMPQGWRSFWDDGTAGTTRPAARDHYIKHARQSHPRNNTSSTSPLQPAVDDEEASTIAPTGRTLLQTQSYRSDAPTLNKHIVDPHVAARNEANIGERNLAMGKTIAEVWPRPPEAAINRAAARRPARPSSARAARRVVA